MESFKPSYVWIYQKRIYFGIIIFIEALFWIKMFKEKSWSELNDFHLSILSKLLKVIILMSFSEVSYVTTLYYVSFYKFVILYDFVKRKFSVNKLAYIH